MSLLKFSALNDLVFSRCFYHLILYGFNDVAGPGGHFCVLGWGRKWLQNKPIRSFSPIGKRGPACFGQKKRKLKNKIK